MKLTCLGGENGELSSPNSFLLNFCQTRVLLECPIDLSALLLFLPTVLPVKEIKAGSLEGRSVAAGSGLLSSSSLGLGSGSGSLSTNSGKKHIEGSGYQQETLLPANKRPKVGIERTSTHASSTQAGCSNKQNHGGNYSLDAAPWYKTPSFHLLDISLLDAVIVSNPLAMLGLPFLIRNPEFNAKIYATDATAKLGQLMMEELVTLHSEFAQLYGRTAEPELPPWLENVPLQEVKGQAPGGNRGGEHWHRLYS